MYCSDNFCNIYKYQIIDSTINIKENIDLKSGVIKLEVYPNPFDKTMHLEFHLPEISIVNIDIYSINGELISNVISNKSFLEGKHIINWKNENLQPGEYIVKLTTNNNSYNNKVLIKK